MVYLRTACSMRVALLHRPQRPALLCPEEAFTLGSSMAGRWALFNLTPPCIQRLTQLSIAWMRRVSELAAREPVSSFGNPDLGTAARSHFRSHGLNDVELDFS